MKAVDPRERFQEEPEEHEEEKPRASSSSMGEEDPNAQKKIEEEQGTTFGTPIAPEQPQAATNKRTPKEPSMRPEGINKYRSEYGRPEAREKEERRERERERPEPKQRYEAPEARHEKEYVKEQGESLSYPMAPEQPQPSTDERTGREEYEKPEGLRGYRAEHQVEDVDEGSQKGPH